MAKRKAVPDRQPKGVRIWFLIVFILGAFSTLAGESLISSLYGAVGNDVVTQLAVPIAGRITAKHIRPGNKGPWGTLDYRLMALEAAGGEPERFRDGFRPLAGRRWIFEDLTAVQITELISTCAMTAEQREVLLDTNHWEVLTNGYAISPSDSLVQGLSPASKQTLYAALGRNEKNFSQWRPFRIYSGEFDDLFAESGLAVDKVKMIRSMVYTNSIGDICLCADEPMFSCFSKDEFFTLTRTLYAMPTWRVTVRPPSLADVNAMVAYWGRGSREKMIRPFLDSVARSKMEDRINISVLMPPFARLHLYTYPDLKDPTAGEQDCFYTALNFFNQQPDPKYLVQANVKKTLMEDYQLATGDTQFGDLLVFFDSAGISVHICVCVADDIVFTKEGMGVNHPWVLMKVADVWSDYSYKAPLHTRLLRRKDFKG